ncbi:MAG: ThiF family adenylyltransferase [Euryarchaeota archaeon]|nr:ThiF family adenylyltransferase [Euryarchaeota archaeon]
MIGGGGLGGPYCWNIVRMGIGYLVICDPDFVELSNLSRQFFYKDQTGTNKALALAENLKRECTGETTVEAYPYSFERLVVEYPSTLVGVDLIVCLVDNDETRHYASEYGLANDIPVIFSAISRTSLNGYVFVQQKDGPCYNCVKPENVDNEKHECAAPTAIYTHATAMGIATYACISLIHGSPLMWNWYELVLDADSFVLNRPNRVDCEICGGK